jgi:lipoate-protein ligase A
MTPVGGMHSEAGGSRWRLLDSGPRSAAENIALDAAMLELKEADRIPNTIRLLSFSKPSVLIGYHQSLSQEARLDYCYRQGIEMNRRLTGGGAIYVDSNQLGWELIVNRDDLPAGPVMSDITTLICEGVVRALEILGVEEVSFRPRNDIEVEGRKICGTGGVFEDRALLFQGTLLVDFEPEKMIKALRIPAEKLSRHELNSARERVTSLTDLLSDVPDRKSITGAFSSAFSELLALEIVEEPLSVLEERHAAKRLDEFSSISWIDGVHEPVEERPLLKSVHRCDGGIIRTFASVDTHRKRLKSVCFVGDYFIQPRRAVFDLEAGLMDCRFKDLLERVGSFFETVQPDCMGLGADDFAYGLIRAVEKAAFIEAGIPARELNSISVIGHGRLEEIAGRARLLLLPYCAKQPECEFRSREGCDQCGDCNVGEAYAFAEMSGMEVVSIMNYEHLVDILDEYHGRGHTAMIGCCCGAFMVKHYSTFSGSGMDSILIDIDNTTCYELSQEQLAYRGDFESQTAIKLELLRKVVGLKDAIGYHSLSRGVK